MGNNMHDDLVAELAKAKERIADLKAVLKWLAAQGGLELDVAARISLGFDGEDN
jgi:dienelactone hydrolase